MKSPSIPFDSETPHLSPLRLLRRSLMTDGTARNLPGLLFRQTVFAALGAALVLGSSATRAATNPADNQWPQWRGPLLNGVAPHGDPPIEWSETKNVKWKVTIPGDGNSTPVIWGDKLFVLTAAPTAKKAEAAAQNSPPPAAAQAGAEQSDPARGGQGRGRGGRGGFGGQKPTEIHQFIIQCLDRQTGKLLWQQVSREELPHEGFRQNDGSASPPSPTASTFPLRLAGRTATTERQPVEPDFGDIRSRIPLVKVVRHAARRQSCREWDNEGESFVVALDKNTGKTLWKTPATSELHGPRRWL